MSRGSTLTLYRAYNNFRADSAQIDALKEEYYKYNKKHCWNSLLEERKSAEERAKAEEERERRFREDVPKILRLDMKGDRSYVDDSGRKCMTLDEYRREHYAAFVSAADGRYMDMLLEWNFNSTFDCLINEFGLSYYNFRDNELIIDEEMAREMLVAIEYLLGGKYDDGLEASMNNRFVKVFAEGNDCTSYWKYVYRHAFNKRREYEFNDPSGLTVKVAMPVTSKNAEKPDEEDEDEICERGYAEDNETCEYQMRTVATALRALLEPDEWTMHDDHSLVLVYSCWG